MNGAGDAPGRVFVSGATGLIGGNLQQLWVQLRRMRDSGSDGVLEQDLASVSRKVFKESAQDPFFRGRSEAE